ncbi:MULTISPECIES: P-loop ATPase, Sll1717 family [Cellulosimicrobium]|uniref:P-loop ATPase, Sll1717 family n=1 Tax=Cellulosimicrobium TaxID=157920 RepID=UPI0020CCBBB9|nr:hypothetical protein NMQ07_04235 [Cellulosimicrobium cellulans]
MASKKTRISGGFNLGGDQAEADPLLTEAFFNSGDYRTIEDRRDPRCFVVGRTGSGKSAALQRLETMRSDHVIRINPEDLSLPYITDLHVIKYLDTLNINLDPLWIALWKHVLLVEIIRRRYNINSQAAKRNFFDTLRDLVSRDAGKRAALDYFDEFESKFWCETDERVRDITESFSEKIRTEAGGSLGSGPLTANFGTSGEVDHTSSVSSEQVDRFQRIVNETQLARLNKMMSVLDEDILSSPNDFKYVIIDDLDRDWVDERLSNDLIRCLFRTVHELKRVKNLKIIVALRTNIFRELDFGRRSAGQEEKFRSLVLKMRWTRADLGHLLDERVRVASERAALDARALESLLPVSNSKHGNPVEYILDRTLLRPRDAIAFANECLALGSGKTRLSWSEVYQAEHAYSANRLLALRDEWKVTYPGIDQVLECFRGASPMMRHAELSKCLDSVMLIPSDARDESLKWLLELSAGAWKPGQTSWLEQYAPLVRFLFSIGFLGCRIHAPGRAVFNVDDELFLEADSRIESAQAFYVHRTYHSALDLRVSRPVTAPA